jgi:hypothetical protein
MNKMIAISLLLVMACGSTFAKTVSITSVGQGSSIEQANINAYDKARFKVMAFEPSVVYTWLKGNNDHARTKVVQVPAQITNVVIKDTEAEVFLPKDIPGPVTKIIGGMAIDASLDEHENPKGSIYRVKTTFEFELKKAEEVDRARNIGELQALRDIVSGKALKDNASFVGEGYGQVSAQLLKLQSGMLGLKKENARSIVSFDDIHRDVLYFKDNLLAAIAKTYQEPAVESIYGEVSGDRYIASINIDLGKGCKIGSDDNAVGSLCDLWSQLPKQVTKAIKDNGLLNGVNIERTKKASQARIDMFIQNPLFFAHSPIDKPPYLGLMFRKPEDTDSYSYYPFSPYLSEEEINGGWQQITLPTSRAKNVAPIGHETILQRYGTRIPSPNKHLVVGVTDAYSNAILPDFFATGIVGKSPVTLTVFNLKEREFVDIPLTSDRFLLTAKLQLNWAMPWRGVEYKPNDLELVVWWGKHPAQPGWNSVGEDMAFPSLTHYADAKTQMEILDYYRKNDEIFKIQAVYKYQKQLPTSPGAFAALAYACLNNDSAAMEIPCAYRVPSMMKTVVTVGIKNRVVLHGLGKIVSQNSNPMTKKECWMYAPSIHKMMPCTDAVHLARKSWWMEIGEYPLTDSKHRFSGGLWDDLELRTEPALVPDRFGRGVVEGVATKTPTDTPSVW